MNWKTIQEFPTHEISEFGAIKNIKTGKILSQSLNIKGYYQVNIGNKSRKVHRLLAIAFIPNPENLETVNHKDGVKTNNDLTNLEWMSRPNNVKHSREVLGLIPIPYSKSDSEHHFKGKVGNDSNRGIKIKAVFEDGTEQIFGSADDAGFKLFGDRKLGRAIRQSITRNSKNYRGIKFIKYETNNT